MELKYVAIDGTKQARRQHHPCGLQLCISPCIDAEASTWPGHLPGRSTLRSRVSPHQVRVMPRPALVERLTSFSNQLFIYGGDTGTTCSDHCVVRLGPGLCSHFFIYFIRTPEARDALAARSCNVVLSRWTMDCLDEVLGRLREGSNMPLQASPPPGSPGSSYLRPNHVQAGANQLSVPQLSSRAALHSFRMPTMLT